jgi:type IV pilus assembly protein PilC
MIFNYEAISNTGEKKRGTIDAISKELAIVAIQKKGFIVLSINEEGKGDWKKVVIFKKGIPLKDVVIMSRQISTLFGAQVTALKAFNLVAENVKNKDLTKILDEVANDIKSGVSISDALARHNEVFSDFYVNMVKSGEESGKLVEVFSFLADYLDRQYALSSKIKNALIYPAFVIFVFFAVMIMMFVYIIPKLTIIIKESGQEVPIYTKIVMGLSDFMVQYGVFLLLIAIVFVVYLVRFGKTKKGKEYFDNLKLSIPVFKDIYQKLYLARIADNIDTMLSSGVPILHALEITGTVVGSPVYKEVIRDATEKVKSGSSLSEAFAVHPEIPKMMNGMIKVGEETGSIGKILKTLGLFYSREVNEAVDTMVGLIEPLMIVVLGLGVGVLLASVLMPIYNIAGSF